MERDRYTDLVRWKNSEERKPLIIRGARQVGKTWLMKEFGRREYKKMAYINFEKSRHLRPVFSAGFDTDRILLALKVESGVEITPRDTLLVLDEIQEVPEAIAAMKYFVEEVPQYHVVAAGSLMGMALHAGVSFPVGKVSFLNLEPLTFAEFLRAVGEEALTGLLQTGDWKMIAAFRQKYVERLRQYYFTGGMPEAVRWFAEKKDLTGVREIQKAILDTYELDFSKHAPARQVPRIRMVWNAIPSQLAKENRKFIYGLIRKGARAKEYELAISWLSDCRLVRKVPRVSLPSLPLAAYYDQNAFKLFLNDVGLLAAMGDLAAGVLLEGNRIFNEFKGALTEQYVFQQLAASGEYVIAYWSAERARAEVDFVLQVRDRVVPLEVKAEENLRSKSLRVYREKFSPPLALRTSMSGYREQEGLINIPLYALGTLKRVVTGEKG